MGRELLRDDLKAKLTNEIVKNKFLHKHYKNVYFVSRDVIYGSEVHHDYNEEHLPYTYDKGHLSIVGSLTAAKNFKKSEIYKPLYEAIN